MSNPESDTAPDKHRIPVLKDVVVPDTTAASTRGAQSTPSSHELAPGPAQPWPSERVELLVTELTRRARASLEQTLMSALNEALDEAFERLRIDLQAALREHPVEQPRRSPIARDAETSKR